MGFAYECLAQSLVPFSMAPSVKNQLAADTLLPPVSARQVTEFLVNHDPRECTINKLLPRSQTQRLHTPQDAPSSVLASYPFTPGPGTTTTCSFVPSLPPAKGQAISPWCLQGPVPYWQPTRPASHMPVASPLCPGTGRGEMSCYERSMHHLPACTKDQTNTGSWLALERFGRTTLILATARSWATHG